MNQAELASKLGVSQACVSQWLNGKHKPSGLKAKRLKRLMPELYLEIMEEYHEPDSKRGIQK